jgi:hypothetical protein
MVAAWLKIATLVLKASPASKKQRPHRQNEFSEHQNASNADALTGAGGFCKKLLCMQLTPKRAQSSYAHPEPTRISGIGSGPKPA